MNGWRGLLAGLLLWLLSAGAGAHELGFAELRLTEAAPGEFDWSWSASGAGRSAAPAGLRWPGDCRMRAQRLSCASGRLAGEVAIDGLGEAYSAVLLDIRPLDGRQSVRALTVARPVVLVAASGDGDGIRVGLDYLRLGVAHILGGIDHLFFVVSLLLLVGFERRLIATVTAFTLAHSLTLVLSVLDWLILRPAPVEACIALSIVLVCREALEPRPTLARRQPALPALLFGLVHGMGLSGALKEVGLPGSHLTLALFGFNAGVELGQLLVLLLAWALSAAPWHRRWRQAGRLACLYTMGSVSVFWTLERLRAVLA